MLWVQKINVYKNHKNLVQEALGLTCDCIYRWRIILQGCNPDIVYIKGTENIVADALSRLDLDHNMTSNTRNSNVHLRTKVWAKSCKV